MAGERRKLAGRTRRNGLYSALLPLKAGILLAFLVSSFCASAREISFSCLKPAQWIAPSLPASLLSSLAASDLKSRRLEMEDLQSRLSKSPRLEQELWRIHAKDPNSVALTVIQELAQTAGVDFQFVWPDSETIRIELLAPRGPELGPFRTTINGKSLGEWDAWFRERQPPAWHVLSPTAEIRAGTNTLGIVQESEQDLPIWLHSFRIVPMR